MLILPRIVDRASLLARLLADALPELTPQLFPHVEGPRWVERPEYELPGVLEIKGQILQIQEDARAQVVALEQQIEEKRRELAYLHALLTEQDRPLVLAVRQALLTIGFESVVDVDEEKQFTESAGTSEPRFLDEDLRIEDGTPLVLIEIKGVTGTSTDDDVLQVAKHIGPRQKRLDRTDIRGLAIINHQRHLPPHQRAADPFRDAVLESAAFQDVGVWTTWDLHRLTRSFVKLGWRHAHVVPLFTERCGRVHPIPVHYQLVGTVAKFWDRVGVVSVELNAGELRLGNRIAFELPLEFEEQEVDSLQVDQEPVERAAKGSRAGVKTALTKDQLRPGVLVYLVDVDGQARSRLDG